MGGAQPLAVTLNDGACLIVDVDETRLRRRVGKRYLDEVETDLDAAIAKVLKAKDERRGWSVGYVGNAAEVFPESCAATTPGSSPSTSSRTRPPRTTP
jgi:urocanate hydratase